MATKKQREIVLAKSGGVCWYCGCELKKGWHVDHVIPITRFKTSEITETGYREKMTCEKPHLDTIDNMVPSCQKCNLFKGAFSVEGFRAEIEKQADRAREYSVNFRTAERFGVIKVTNKPVVFWFESNIKPD